MTVYLVGAGPGDPGLLTVRGREVLRHADVVVHDRLAARSLLDLAPAGAERIDVGKTPGHARLSQDEICALLVERGKGGEQVVRLKGGDPFVFARGGEEARALHDAGVPFEVVPGISAAIAAPAYAGIPLTMRHSSTLFTVITGHEDPDKGGEIDWETVARLGGTIVVLMGIGRLPKIVERLRAGGLPDGTPVASVQWGTRPDQRTVRATLGTILDHALEPPATIVIGRVAGLDLRWFEDRPLLGRRVVVTRTVQQAPALADRVLEAGGDPIVVPVIEVTDPSDGGAALRQAAGSVGTYDWLVFTSPNAVGRFFAELRDVRDLGGVAIAAIGDATAALLAERGIVADVVPPAFVAESLLEAMPPPPAAGGRVLLPRAAVARDVLPEGLRGQGWHVDVVDAYRTVPASIGDRQRRAIASADVVTFTSSSTVTNLLDAVGADGLPPVVACIGPVTAATARERGVAVTIEAEVHTVAGLVDALVAWATEQSS